MKCSYEKKHIMPDLLCVLMPFDDNKSTNPHMFVKGRSVVQFYRTFFYLSRDLVPLTWQEIV